MSSRKNDISRRAMLKGLAAIPVIAAVGFSARASAAEALSVNDPMAKALKYTEKSTMAGKHCGVCGMYQGGKAASGPCLVFSGKIVKATGWCTSFVPKS